jgi:hypothetical protein
VAVVIDIYDSTHNRAVAIQGTGEFIERGEDFKKMYDIFYRKFEWVRQEPWNEGEAPFVVVKPFKLGFGVRIFKPKKYEKISYQTVKNFSSQN